MSQIVQAVRAYTNFREEGRVRVNQLFAVEKPAEHKGQKLRVIASARANVLLGQGLMRVFDPTSTMAPVHTTAVPAYAGQGKPAQKKPIETQRRSAAAAREAAPKAPAPLVNPSAGKGAPAAKPVQAGGKTGATASSSSSAGARPPSNVPLPKRRGVRKGSKPSPSTTPTNSSPGPASSTPATGPGGVSIKDARPSKA
jgi:hypothetical protein